ncbi:unnamed protein product [Lactuca saligna]|uniref:Uncharacterized protein n=1 Tax=Lactuca saligna TaxID=75948 RepID=A0AA35Z1S1_LACSI|nr:unnamed protein product [Lactuca saligna]
MVATTVAGNHGGFPCFSGSSNPRHPQVSRTRLQHTHTHTRTNSGREHRSQWNSHVAATVATLIQQQRNKWRRAAARAVTYQQTEQREEEKVVQITKYIITNGDEETITQVPISRFVIKSHGSKLVDIHGRRWWGRPEVVGMEMPAATRGK